MALLSTVVWTVLPKAYTPDTLEFSVFASFRLAGTGTTLGDYNLGNWPKRLAALAQAKGLLAELQWLGALVPVQLDASVLRPDVWDALFPAKTLVRPHTFQDHSKRPLLSYRAHELHTYLEQLYAALGDANPSQFPVLNAPGPLNDLVTELGPLRNSARDVSKSNIWRAGPHPNKEAEDHYLQGASSAPLPTFYNAWRFYHREEGEKYRSQRDPVDPASVPPPIDVPSFDFHQVVAAVGDHPQLMRMLGLVLDCRLSIKDIGTAPPASDKLRLQVAWPGDPTKDETPWTLYTIDAAKRFRAKERPGSDQVAGLLQLGNLDLFDVAQLDVDGQVLKTLDFASNMHRVLSKLNGQVAPRRESLPAGRNGGLTVFRKNRDYALAARFDSQKNINANLSLETVYSDDVTRGYRVDINVDGKWRSLCERTGAYQVGALPPLKAMPDEGYVKAASATSVADPQGPNPPDMYAHEAVFGWDNWSLVVPRPGKSISFDRDDAAGTETLAIRNEPNVPPPEFPLHTLMGATPGSLPRLRFGKTYKIRARVVDLAGNSLPPSPTDFTEPYAESNKVEYLRYEPIPPPVLVMRDPIGLAESSERIVVRTKVNDGVIPGINEQREFNSQCRRFVAPPKTSQMLAELHGAFDPYFSDPTLAYKIAAKESGTFNDPSLVGIQLIDIKGNAIAFPSGFTRGDPLPNSTYTIQTVTSLPLPYLPDPPGIGWVIRDFPGKPLIEEHFSGIASWPDYQPFGLMLEVTGTSTPSWQSSNVETKVALPRGTMVTVRMSSAISKADLKLMARFRALSTATQTAVLAAANQHWMVTPWREVTFVHAVEKPLATPAVSTKLKAYRTPGSTYAELDGSFSTAHPQSTGSIEMRVTWQEYEDRLGDPAPVVEDREGPVFEREIGYEESSAEFPKSPGQERPRHELGDTKHRIMSYYPRATTRYREYFSPELYNQIDKITVEGAALVRNIPSTARPDVPQIVDVIPTFRWEDTPTGRKRIGRGLRIYLGRPWWSSGEGELLAVLLAPGSAPEKLRGYTSEWGRDPAFSSSTPSTDLVAGDFIAVSNDPDDEIVQNPSPLHVAELVPADPTQYPPNLGVNVVAFKPRYNHDRQLHFVDIEMDAKQSYFPFVRLGLARYQPDSISELHLSKVVRTEFAQLVADRSATLTYQTGEVFVSLSGIAPHSNVGDLLASQILPKPKVQLGTKSQALQLLPTMKEDWRYGAGRLVQCHVERLDNPASPDFGWTPAGATVTLPSYKLFPVSGDTIHWRGPVPLPSGLGTDGKEYRLVVQEYELFETDPGVGEDLPNVINLLGIPLRRRLVYTDLFPLNP